MNKASRALLIKLLHSWQKNQQRFRKTTLPVTPERALPYFEATLPEEKEALHAGLFEAEAVGAIELQWGKGYESHLLSRLVLADGPALAQYLGVSLAATVAGEARPVLEPLVSGRESWISSWVEELLDRWSRNQPLDGIAAGDLSTAKDLVIALEAVSAGRHLNLDLRTFSVREFGSSKAMEASLTRFAAVWKRLPCILSPQQDDPLTLQLH